MPHMTDRQLAENHCKGCYYLQKATSWCCRINCYRENEARADGWKREWTAKLKESRKLNRQRPSRPDARERMNEIWEQRREQLEQQHQERLALYNQGLTDRQIAEKLGSSKTTIAMWRHKHGLDSHIRVGKPNVSEEEAKRRMDAYNASHSDREAARMLNMSPSTFQLWRSTKGLPAKYRA